MKSAYIASSFSLVDRVEELVVALPPAYEPAIRWWDYEAKEDESIAESPVGYYDMGLTKQICWGNFHYIEEADAFILVADEEPRKFNGANVELGYAIANEVPCFVWGELEDSAMYVPVKPIRMLDRLKGLLP